MVADDIIIIIIFIIIIIIITIIIMFQGNTTALHAWQRVHAKQ